MFLEVVEHQGVGIFQHFFQGFEREEDLVDGVGGGIAEITAFHFVTLNFLFDYGGNHIVFIGEELVDRLFGNAQLGRYFVHGDGADAVAAEEVGCLYQYSFFYFHCSPGWQNYGNFYTFQSFHGFFSNLIGEWGGADAGIMTNFGA